MKCRQRQTQLIIYLAKTIYWCVTTEPQGEGSVISNNAKTGPVPKIPQTDSTAWQLIRGGTDTSTKLKKETLCMLEAEYVDKDKVMFQKHIFCQLMLFYLAGLKRKSDTVTTSEYISTYLTSYIKLTSMLHSLMQLSGVILFVSMPPSHGRLHSWFLSIFYFPPRQAVSLVLSPDSTVHLTCHPLVWLSVAVIWVTGKVQRVQGADAACAIWRKTVRDTSEMSIRLNHVRWVHYQAALRS